MNYLTTGGGVLGTTLASAGTVLAANTTAGSAVLGSCPASVLNLLPLLSLGALFLVLISFLAGYLTKKYLARAQEAKAVDWVTYQDVEECQGARPAVSL